MTRSEYIETPRNSEAERNAAHQEYYAQFVTPQIRAIVSSHIGLDKIRASKDRSFNDIPLSKWDALKQCFSSCGISAAMKEQGDYLTLSGIVCIAKEAARQLKLENATV